MKRTAVYCLISGILGGVLAFALSRGPSMEPILAAQELRAGVPGAGPVGGPALALPAAARRSAYRAAGCGNRRSPKSAGSGRIHG